MECIQRRRLCDAMRQRLQHDIRYQSGRRSNSQTYSLSTLSISRSHDLPEYRHTLDISNRGHATNSNACGTRVSTTVCKDFLEFQKSLSISLSLPTSHLSQSLFLCLSLSRSRCVSLFPSLSLSLSLFLLILSECSPPCSEQALGSTLFNRQCRLQGSFSNGWLVHAGHGMGPHPLHTPVQGCTANAVQRTRSHLKGMIQNAFFLEWNRHFASSFGYALSVWGNGCLPKLA